MVYTEVSFYIPNVLRKLWYLPKRFTELVISVSPISIVLSDLNMCRMEIKDSTTTASKSNQLDDCSYSILPS